MDETFKNKKVEEDFIILTEDLIKDINLIKTNKTTNGRKTFK